MAEAAAARLERARGALGALEAALGLEEEDGDVPARVLLEHLVDTRRRQKLLLTQLRVLQRLLGVLHGPAAPPPPPALSSAEARGRWRGLKSGYGGALATLGGALPPALAQLGRGRSLGGALGGRLRQLEELEAKLREAAGRREKLQRHVTERRRERQDQQGALRRRREAAGRAGAGGRLYRTLTGVEVLPLPPPSREPEGPPGGQRVLPPNKGPTDPGPPSAAPQEGTGGLGGAP